MAWGANPAGVQWQIDPVHDSDFSASLGRGRIANPTVGVFRAAHLPYEVAAVDLTVNVQTNQAAAGSWINAYVQHLHPSGDYLSARVEYRDDGQASMSLYEVINGGATTVLRTVIVGTYTASSPLMLRVQIRDGYVRAKTWPRGTAEAEHWQVGARTVLSGAGRIGLGSVLSDGNTNTNPEVSWGALRIANPQQFTVVRAVNDVRKAHAAGTDLRLAHPSVIAL